MSAVSKVDLVDLGEATRKINVLEEWMERQELLHGGDRDQPNIEAQPCTISYETRSADNVFKNHDIDYCSPP